MAPTSDMPDIHWPDSLEHLIMSHHRNHSNSLRLAHFNGCGKGAYLPILGEYFQHVHASDPDKGNLAKARRDMTAWSSKNWWKGRFTLDCASMEEATQSIVPGTCDLALMLQTAHMENILHRFTSRVAESLTPNGTLAVVQRSPFCTVLDNEEVAQLAQQMYADIAQIINHTHSFVYTETGFNTDDSAFRLSRLQAGLNWFNLPEGDFIQDVTKRILINAPNGLRAAFGIPGLEGCDPSRFEVNPSHRLYHYGDESTYGHGWRQKVTAAFFSDVARQIISLLKWHDELTEVEDRLFEIEEAIARTAPGEDGRQTVTVELSAAVLLATKN